MQGPPNKKPAPVWKTGSGQTEDLGGEPNEVAYSSEETRANGEWTDLSPQVLCDVRWAAWTDTAIAPDKLKALVIGACSREILNLEGLQLARVRFGKRQFSLDTAGLWAAVIPMYEHDELVDIAAFDLTDDSKVQLYRGIGVAAGVDEALHDGHYHPHGRVLVHAGVWPWLRSDCVGLLPVDWLRTALLLKSRQVRGILVSDDASGLLVHKRLAQALRPPELFVLREIEAA
jgi:hypothetical protein